MSHRLDDLPIYQHTESEVSAEHYNIVQIALKRLENPLRFRLPKLRSLDLVLEKEAWMVVDREMNDVPVMAWTRFKTQQRALHEAVVCDLNFYHAHAVIIIAKVMEAMALVLGERLSKLVPDDEDSVTPFRDIHRDGS